MTTNTTHQASAVPAAETRNRATLTHLSAFLMFLGIPSVIGPLVAWLAWKDEPYVGQQAKEALNFNLSFLIYGIVSAVAILLLVGLIALPAVFLAWFVLVIDASVKSAKGADYRYPFTIRFIA